MQFTKPRRNPSTSLFLILLVAGGLAVLSACRTSGKPAPSGKDTPNGGGTERFALLQITVEG